MVYRVNLLKKKKTVKYYNNLE